MGHLALNEIEPFHIATYKELKLGEDGKVNGGRLNPATINKHLSLISDVLKDAASPEKRLIPYNPALLVTRLQGANSKKAAMVNCLTLEQINDLLHKLSALYTLRRLPKTEKEKKDVIATLKSVGYTEEEIKSPKALFRFRVVTLYPLVFLGARTGMRLSELLALKWSYIDFVEGVIRVFESSHYGKKDDEDGGHHINCTKEGKPKSYIELSSKDIEFLKQHRKDQQEHRLRYPRKYFDNDLVFAAKNGSYLRNETVSGEFTDFARANGFSISFHGLRHTHCTLLISVGVPLMYVARRVGHQKTSTTSNFYSHADKSGGANLGNVFNSILEGKKDITPNQFLDAQQKAAKLLGVVGC